MKNSEQAMPVLRKIYNLFKSNEGGNNKLDYNTLHKELPDLDPDQIKSLCGHLEEKGYITVSSDPVFPDIRITDVGMRFHESNP